MNTMNVLLNSRLRLNRFLISAMLISAIGFTSCNKDEEPVLTHDYLLSFSKVNNFSASFIKIMLNSMNTVYPGIDTLAKDVAYGIDLYTITYNTTFKGNPVIASGLVSIPKSSESFPILSFQNGTNTFSLNAPSINPSDPMYTLMEMMGSHGYIVVMPDYLGYGASSTMLHPYYDKLSTTDAVTDMILAVQELVTESSVDAESNGDHFLMGYSQGGWATLATLKAAEAIPDNKISVVAASCGAGAYDLTAMSEYVLGLETFPGPLYLPFFIYSKITAGDITEPLTTYFKEPYASRIPVAFNGNYTNTQVNDTLTDTIPNLVTDELRLNLATGAEFGSLRAAMSNNSIQAWNTSATIRFYHGTADQNVPPVQSELIYNQFTSLGLTPPAVTLIPIPGATHDSGLIPWGITTISWFDSIKK